MSAYHLLSLRDPRTEHPCRSYAARIMYLRQPIFQCEGTGETDINFDEAQASDIASKADTWLKFPKGMRGAILRSCQFVVEGRMEDLVDRVWDRFHERFFPMDKVYVDVGDERLLANVVEVIPPSLDPNSNGSGNPPSSAKKKKPHTSSAYHRIGTNLEMDDRESMKADDPAAYRYVVDLITKKDQIKYQKTHVSPDGEKVSTWNQKFRIEVDANQLSRDRLWFNKVALKKFLREWLDRDIAMYSPWLVNPIAARLYQIPTEIPSSKREKIEEHREKELNKRRRPKDGKDEEIEEKPTKKKQKKETEQSAAALAEKLEKTKAKTVAAKAKKAEEERVRKEQEEKDRLEAEKKKRRPTKFPAEDLLIEMTDREKNEGKLKEKPSVSRALPFPGQFDTFFSTWCFINSMTGPLALSPFSIDEFENALYHDDPYTPCNLMTETHASLLNLISADVRVSDQPPTFPLKAFGPQEVETDDRATSLSEEDGDELMDEEEEEKQEKMALTVTAATAHAQKWEGKDLVAKDGRKGWEMSLVGCLFQRSNEKTLPNLRHYLQHLLFEEDTRRNSSNGRPTWSATSTRPKLTKRLDQRYQTLHPTFKLEILAFLCELAVQTQVIRETFEEAASALTKCRNDQQDVRREIKRAREERQALEPKDPAQNETKEGEENGDEKDLEEFPTETYELEVESVGSSADESSDLANGVQATAASRQKALREQQVLREAEAAQKTAQLAKDKAEMAAKRKEKETINEHKRRLHAEELKWQNELARLDREFRKNTFAFRAGPFGQDRFGNRYWWMDGCGTADLVTPSGQIVYGTGRVYLQGPQEWELEKRVEDHELDVKEVEEKRDAEEPVDSRLKEDEWAVIDDVDQVSVEQNEGAVA